ncbi:MAG TPA: hypothetical protein VNH83_16750 [Bryobacteraceae bacterium]|nr:hypothetical protein [Bryobacteraceae bacterium]
MPSHIKLVPLVAPGRACCEPAALCRRERRPWRKHSCLPSFPPRSRRLGVNFFPAIVLSALTATAATPPDPAALTTSFAVLDADPGSWPQILSSIGFQPRLEASAGILILRSGSLAPAHLTERIEQGAIAIFEGASLAAESFGFRPTKDRVSVVSVEDVHCPSLRIIWEKSADIPRFEVPKTARVFAKERWTGAPLIAGFTSGRGAVLWVAANPGEHGYERFPYIVQALRDLGLAAPFRSARLWAFFDYAYRMRIDLDYFAARWRAAGISALQVAAWHYYDADPERDRYVQSLIQACHRHGILVYAWIELPHVSGQFWNAHPEWREKTAVLQDAQLDWRKLMNLTNRDCFRAASKGIKELITRFDWDGVNLAELYFESLEGAGNPARFTPMNDDVRREFRAAHGFDPIELFQDRKDAASLKLFLDFRASLAGRIQEEWIGEIEKVRHTRPELDFVLTHVDDRFDTGMKDAIGADVTRVLPQLETRDFTFLIEDPATVWNLGPQRYPEIAKRYQPLTRHAGKLAIDINIVDRYQDVYPTKQQTGAELFQLVHLAASAFPRVALYFENSILPPDLSLLSAAGAIVPHFERSGSKAILDSPYMVGIAWRGDALVDGRPWPVSDGNIIWLPAGAHSIEPAVLLEARNRVAAGEQIGEPVPALSRVLDFNGELRSAERTDDSTIELSYDNSSRALAMLDRKPDRLEIDGAAASLTVVPSDKRFILLLPRGQHLVTIHTE